MSSKAWLDGLMPETEDWAREMVAARLDAGDAAISFVRWMNAHPNLYIGAIGREMIEEALRAADKATRDAD